MRISINNNPIDKLSCIIHNKLEDLSRVHWLMGKHKKIECRICGTILDSYRETFSPMQCRWGKINKYTWICHKCLCHRDFTPYIEQIDEDGRKSWERRNNEQISNSNRYT